MTKKVVMPEKELSSQKLTTEEILYKPGKYEITPDDDFKIEFALKMVDKRWIITQNGEENHWIVFRMWNYEEEIELRKKATIFDEIRRIYNIDNDILDRYKIQRLLKDWSFSKDNERLKIHRINGVLTDECYKNIMKLHPTILRFIIDCMNGVLERNG